MDYSQLEEKRLDYWGNEPRVLIIVLTYNGKTDTAECLNSLARITYRNYQVLVVDNASTDGTVEYLEEHFPGVPILPLKENRYYAGGNNAGLRYAMDKGFEYALLINNDTLVHPDFLSELVLAASRAPWAAFFGPKVYYYGKHDCPGYLAKEGVIDVTGETLEDVPLTDRNVISFAGGQIDKRRGRAVHLRHDETDTTPDYYDEGVKSVGFVEGSCMLVRVEVLYDIGLLDEDFGIYWEETDLCERARQRGYGVLYVPTAKMWHKISGTGGNQYLWHRNRYWYLKRYSTRRQYIESTLWHLGIDTPLLLAHFVRKGDYKRAKDLIRGTLHGLLGEERVLKKEKIR